MNQEKSKKLPCLGVQIQKHFTKSTINPYSKEKKIQIFPKKKKQEEKIQRNFVLPTICNNSITGIKVEKNFQF